MRVPLGVILATRAVSGRPQEPLGGSFWDTWATFSQLGRHFSPLAKVSHSERADAAETTEIHGFGEIAVFQKGLIFGDFRAVLDALGFTFGPVAVIL